MNQSSAGARPPLVTCPSCRQECVFGPQNPYRPFCSERCRQADFGDWANERYRVAAPGPVSDDEGSEPGASPH